MKRRPDLLLGLAFLLGVVTVGLWCWLVLDIFSYLLSIGVPRRIIDLTCVVAVLATATKILSRVGGDK